MRSSLDASTAEALQWALSRKQSCPDDLSLAPEVVADIKLILEEDTWDGEPSGAKWLKSWLKKGINWARSLQENRGANQGGFYCGACWESFKTRDQWEAHLKSDKHKTGLKDYRWRYGIEPQLIVDANAPAAAPWGTSTGSADREDAPTTTSKAVANILKRTAKHLGSPVAVAKRRLLEFRNSLSDAERQEVLRRFNLPRANDVNNLEELQSHFRDNTMVAESLREVAEQEDKKGLDWICREPTFSWLSGFYWHPNATQLEQQGEPHSEGFCHLCECDCGSEEALRAHMVTRRHAENALRWAEQMGNLDHPSHCGRCPAASSSSSSSSGAGAKSAAWGNGGWRRRWDMDVDLEHRRCPSIPDPAVKPETSPPSGFTSTHQGFRGTVLATSYFAASIKVQSSVHAVRLLSKLEIGPKDKSSKSHGRGSKRWYIDFFWCEHSGTWKTLALPLPSSVAPGESVDFTVAVRWSKDEAAPYDELDSDHLKIQVPREGTVAYLQADFTGQWKSGSGNESRNTKRIQSGEVYVHCRNIFDFVGRGQVETAGGIENMRGTQRPVQFATEDAMMTFLFYVPPSDEPAPLLLYFHGDLPRDAANCPQPGLTDFAETYGPAELVTSDKKKNHPARDFVVVTPCCSKDVWWLRYPAEHDAMSYVETHERCLRGLIDMMYDLRLCRREAGACFAGQSMGGYMALEMARAMPEGTAAVFAGAPCFDACRLNHLAERLVNVPLWLLIGRNDTLCSFEEVASLALKMKDLDSKCVRLTSTGIKGHAEVGKKLEKAELFEWLKNPLG